MKEKNITRNLWIVFFVLLLSAMCAVTCKGQMIYKNSKVTAYVDTIESRGGTFVLKNKLTGAIAWMRVQAILFI